MAPTIYGMDEIMNGARNELKLSTTNWLKASYADFAIAVANAFNVSKKVV